MTDRPIAIRSFAESLAAEMQRSYLDYAMSIIVGRAYEDELFLCSLEQMSDKAEILVRILSHLLRKVTSKDDGSGHRHCTKFSDVSKPCLALTIPLGIRAPPGQQYSPEENAPNGAF